MSAGRTLPACTAGPRGPGSGPGWSPRSPSAGGRRTGGAAGYPAPPAAAGSQRSAGPHGGPGVDKVIIVNCRLKNLIWGNSG